MAQHAVDQIIQIMRNKQEKDLATNQQLIEQQRNESEAENRAQNVKLAQQQLSQNKEVADRQFALAQKAADLQHSLTMQQIGQNIQQGAPAPPGSTVTPLETGGGGSVGAGTFGFGGGQGGQTFQPQQTSQPQTIAPTPGVYNTIKLPSGDVFPSLASPQVYAQQQADRERILSAPATESKIAEATAVAGVTQGAETERQLLVGKQNQDAMLRLHQYDMEMENQRNKDMIAGENQRNAATLGMQKTIAMLPYTMFNDMFKTPQDQAAFVKPYGDALYSANMSDKQLDSDFANKGMASAALAIKGNLMQQGVVLPNEKQVAYKQALKPVVDLLPKIQEYISLLPQSSSWLAGKLSGTKNAINMRLEALHAEIESQSSSVAKTISGDEDQRLQQAMIGASKGGYLPDKYDPKTYNASIFNNFLDTINHAVDSHFASMSAGQKAAIKNDLGLSGISRLNPDGTPMTPPAQVQTQTPAANIRYAIDGKGNRISTSDGGKTWQPVPKQ